MVVTPLERHFWVSVREIKQTLRSLNEILIRTPSGLRDAIPIGICYNGAVLVSGLTKHSMFLVQRHHRFADRLAIVFSGTCLLHCLALPLLVTLFPIAQSAFMDEATFHLLMLVLILPTSLLALTTGCFKHKDRLTITLGGIGLAVLAVTALFGHDLFGLDGERIVTSVGGVILATSHIRNYLLCRHDDCDHDHGESHVSGPQEAGQS